MKTEIIYYTILYILYTTTYFRYIILMFSIKNMFMMLLLKIIIFFKNNYGVQRNEAEWMQRMSLLSIYIFTSISFYKFYKYM